MPFDSDQHRAKAQNQAKENKAFLSRIKKKHPKIWTIKPVNFTTRPLPVSTVWNAPTVVKASAPL